MFLEMFELLIVISLLGIVIYEIKIIKSHIGQNRRNDPALCEESNYVK